MSLNGQPGNGWTGNTGFGWLDAIIDLSAFDGEDTVYVRFVLNTSPTNTDDGWYIDDIYLDGDQ